MRRTEIILRERQKDLSCYATETGLVYSRIYSGKKLWSDHLSISLFLFGPIHPECFFLSLFFSPLSLDIAALNNPLLTYSILHSNPTHFITTAEVIDGEDLAKQLVVPLVHVADDASMQRLNEGETVIRKDRYKPN